MRPENWEYTTVIKGGKIKGMYYRGEPLKRVGALVKAKQMQSQWSIATGKTQRLTCDELRVGFPRPFAVSSHQGERR